MMSVGVKHNKVFLLWEMEMLNNLKELVLEISKLEKAHNILMRVYHEIVYEKEPISEKLREEIITFFRFDDSE